ncbi:Uu.00g001050.m01.CDS01 [Anthostomella pinea]|uniref:Uu.00g001050.m01.CDS01 n=1 Tax=Anthostomella pinea TaxID=933095 RepID=A0AAI8VJA7_9PEZI|nr:Uu.00g001050.m01.CDS01 [Anthostomella pinea]
MADPFEVRMRFSSQLQHLNASTASSQKAAQYAIKYKDMDEDLHSCILEQLEKSNMNTRANIMYFIEHLMDMASKERHNEYVRMLQRDIIRVVDAVCPEDGSGAANVKVIRRVLQGLQNKHILIDTTVIELEACLKERDTSVTDLVVSSPVNGDATNPTATADEDSGARNGANGASARPDKRQIEQRIEEDRERHKRMRESMWAVPPNVLEEADNMFDDTSDFDAEDHIRGEEELDEVYTENEEVKCGHFQTPRTNGASKHRRDSINSNQTMTDQGS